MNTVYKLFKCPFSYTRVNAKLEFGKTSFVNMAVIIIVNVFVLAGMADRCLLCSESFKYDDGYWHKWAVLSITDASY